MEQQWQNAENYWSKKFCTKVSVDVWKLEISQHAVQT